MRSAAKEACLWFRMAEIVPKKQRLSLSLRDTRFKPITQNQVQELEKKIVPKSTTAATQWAMKIFREWFADYNDRKTDQEKCPDIVLSSDCPSDVLNKWMTVFVEETRNSDGENYPPRSLNSILSGTLRYTRDETSFLLSYSWCNSTRWRWPVVYCDTNREERHFDENGENHVRIDGSKSNHSWIIIIVRCWCSRKNNPKKNRPLIFRWTKGIWTSNWWSKTQKFLKFLLLKQIWGNLPQFKSGRSAIYWA